MQLPTPAVPSRTYEFGWQDGVRYLANDYQYVTLFIMLGFAAKEGKHKPSKHEKMEFTSMEDVDNGTYKVPADLTSVRDWLNEQAIAFTGSNKRETLTFVSDTQKRHIRNKYLHRSARLITEVKIGMAGRNDGARDGYHRLVIPDDVQYEKPQDTVWRKTTEAKDATVKKATEVKDATVKKATELKDATVEKATELKDATVEKATELKDAALKKATQLQDAAAEARKTLADQLDKLRNWYNK